MQEKRRWPRAACRERCIVQAYAESPTLRGAMILNSSRQGFGIETDAPLQDGERVMIGIPDRAAGMSLPGVGRRVGRMRWCSPRPESSPRRYAAGIEILGGVSEQLPPTHLA